MKTEKEVLEDLYAELDATTNIEKIIVKIAFMWGQTYAINKANERLEKLNSHE